MSSGDICYNTTLALRFCLSTMWITLAVVVVWCSTAKGQTDEFNQFGGKLTAERGGPPAGAAFQPIAVIQFAPGRNNRPIRYKPGQPPPPPPPLPAPRPKPPTRPPSPAGTTQPPQFAQQPLPQPPQPPPEPPQQPPQGAPTTTAGSQDSLPAYYHRFLQNDDLSYYFDFQSANKITRSEQGFFKSEGPDLLPILVKTGTYSFTSPEGFKFRINYVADENGYRTFPSTP